MAKFLCFKLDIDSGGWPPAGAESIPVEVSGSAFRILLPPFFVKDLSVDDVIKCNFDNEGYVQSIHHEYRSDRSTVWLATMGLAQWQPAKERLLALGCNIETFKQYDLSSIDLPADVSLFTFDTLVKPIIEAGRYVVFPSLRHPTE